MAESIRRIQYFYVMAPDKPGEGARALQTLKEAGVNLLAFSGFPAGKRAQLDFVPEDPAAFRAAARKAKWKVTGPKVGFLIEGDDRTGVMADIYQKLAAARINITASDAVIGGAGRFGAILWVKARDVNRTAKISRRLLTVSPVDTPDDSRIGLEGRPSNRGQQEGSTMKLTKKVITGVLIAGFLATTLMVPQVADAGGRRWKRGGGHRHASPSSRWGPPSPAEQVPFWGGLAVGAVTGVVVGSILAPRVVTPRRRRSCPAGASGGLPAGVLDLLGRHSLERLSSGCRATGRRPAGKLAHPPTARRARIDDPGPVFFGGSQPTVPVGWHR